MAKVNVMRLSDAPEKNRVLGNAILKVMIKAKMSEADSFNTILNVTLTMAETFNVPAEVLHQAVDAFYFANNPPPANTPS